MRDCLGWVFSNDCCWLMTICWTPPVLPSESSGPLELGIRNALGLSNRARGDTLSFVSQILSSMEWLKSWRIISLVIVAVWLNDKNIRSCYIQNAINMSNQKFSLLYLFPTTHKRWIYGNSLRSRLGVQRLWKSRYTVGSDIEPKQPSFEGYFQPNVNPNF